MMFWGEIANYVTLKKLSVFNALRIYERLH